MAIFIKHDTVDRPETRLAGVVERLSSPFIASINHDVAFFQETPHTLDCGIDCCSCLDKEHHTPAGSVYHWNPWHSRKIKACSCTSHSQEEDWVLQCSDQEEGGPCTHTSEGVLPWLLQGPNELLKLLVAVEILSQSCSEGLQLQGQYSDKSTHLICIRLNICIAARTFFLGTLHSGLCLFV